MLTILLSPAAAVVAAHQTAPVKVAAVQVGFALQLRLLSRLEFQLL
jgi:hypothetical protein